MSLESTLKADGVDYYITLLAFSKKNCDLNMNLQSVDYIDNWFVLERCNQESIHEVQVCVIDLKFSELDWDLINNRVQLILEEDDRIDFLFAFIDGYFDFEVLKSTVFVERIYGYSDKERKVFFSHFFSFSEWKARRVKFVGQLKRLL